MGNLYTTLPDRFNEQQRNFNRLLKRLKIALVIWLVCFIVTVIWFTYAH